MKRILLALLLLWPATAFAAGGTTIFPTHPLNGNILLTLDAGAVVPDTKTICFGTGSDVCMSYDGTDFLLKLREVGTGNFDIQDGHITWSQTGVAVTAADYSIGRDADGTNQMHFNVPTGATTEWSVNDVSVMTLSATTLAAPAITGTTIDATTDFTVGGLVITDGALADTGLLLLDGVLGVTIGNAGTTAESMGLDDLFASADMEVAGVSHFKGAVNLDSSSNQADDTNKVWGAGTDTLMTWDLNGTGDDLFVVKARKVGANDSAAIFLTRDSNPNNMADHDDYLSPTLVLTNDENATAGDYAGVIIGPKTVSDMTAAWYFEFEAITGAFDGSVGGSPVAPAFRFGNSPAACATATTAGDVCMNDKLEVDGATDLDGTLDVAGALTAVAGGALTGTWTDLGTVTTMDLNGGTADAVVIGGASAAAATVTTLTNTGLHTTSVGAGLTADTNKDQANALALTKNINEVSVVAGALDAVAMPAAVAGYDIEVINNGVSTLAIFPANGASDNLGAGVDVAIELEPNESIELVAYDTTNWKTIASTEIIHAEMGDTDNSDAFLITGQDDHTCYHTNGLAAGDLAGWTFDAGGAGTGFTTDLIVAADSSGGAAGSIEVRTDAAHGLSVGDIISMSGYSTSTYNSLFVVTRVEDTTHYDVVVTFVDDVDGEMDQCASLIANVGSAGQYLVNWSASVTPAGSNDTFEFHSHNEASIINFLKSENKFGTAADFQTIGGAAIITVGDGDHISFIVYNTGGTGNLTVKHFSYTLIRL